MSPARRTQTETTPPITPVAAFLPSERTLPALREAILRMIEANVRAAAQEALVNDLRQILKHVPLDAHAAASRPHA